MKRQAIKRRTMKTDTLSFRLFLFTSLWMLVALAIVAILVSRDYRLSVEEQFQSLITANLYNLMGSIKRDANGKLFGAPQLGDGRYQQYQSGWYWTVSPQGNNSSSLSSPSLAGLELPTPTNTQYDADFQRSYRVKDALNNSLMIIEAQVYLGEGDDLYNFRTSGNLQVLNEEIVKFRQRLILLLGLFGIGLIATSFAVVRFGLKPIRLATSQLADIRKGKADQIKGRFPQEIMPLIEETNALIKSNQAIVERSRTQVGNLAHSLKTPLSILSLEIKGLPKPVEKIAQTQLSAMNSQIQSYLNRAMISARHGTITSRTDVDATLVRLVRTFTKIFPEISFVYNQPPQPGQAIDQTNDEAEKFVGRFDGIFAGEQQDFEEIIGNILENAGNSARRSVEITVRKISSKSGPLIEVEIIDDGPGLSKSDIEYVLKRGNRLDQNKPGTGLGLSIVSDILKEYGGRMELNTVEAGGLWVHIFLPAVNQSMPN
jgi:signal transduction histidine kinase